MTSGHPSITRTTDDADVKRLQTSIPESRMVRAQDMLRVGWVTLLCDATNKLINYNPPQKSVPKGRRHKAGGFSAEVPSGRIFEGGLKGNDQKK